MTAAQLLLVEDDTAMRQMLESLFRGEGYHVSEASSAKAALDLARTTDFDVVLSDIRMPGKSGLDLLRELRVLRPDTPVVLMTAFGSVDTAIDAMRTGAFGYTTKPFEPEEVLETVNRALSRRRVEERNRADHERRDETFQNLVGDSAAMRAVYAVIRRAAQVDANVLISGESGTGKAVVARTLHHHGVRASGPFLSVSCGAIAESVLEAELFGYAPGAFAGANEAKRGLLARADGGTLFLDEVGDLGPAVQAKLLRVLQDGQILPLGAVEPVRVDVRIIAATRRDLEADVEEGRFRRELYYRLNVIPIHLRPLRERAEDIPALVEAFVRRQSGARPRRFSREALRRLQECAWRGNVRELGNLVQRTLALCDADLIHVCDLRLDGAGESDASDHALELGLAEAARAGLTLRDVEDRYIARVLARTGGKKGEAARLLGIDRKTLYRRNPKD